MDTWFTIPTRQALRGASFANVKQLREVLSPLIVVYDPKAAPFEGKKRLVHPVGLNNK